MSLGTCERLIQQRGASRFSGVGQVRSFFLIGTNRGSWGVLCGGIRAVCAGVCGCGDWETIRRTEAPRLAEPCSPISSVLKSAAV
jgi:hypothetical protein